MRKLWTFFQKECLENRGSIFLLPLIIAAIFVTILIGALLWPDVQMITWSDQANQALASLEPTAQQQIGRAILTGLSIPFFVPMIFVTLFYLAHALFDDRKDRSILFWKSLPVSDKLTVGAKLLMAMVVIPLVYLVFSLLTQCITLVGLGAYGLSQEINWASSLWSPGMILSHWLTTITALITHGFWMLPIYAWLLLCSSFAPRSPLMIAVAVPALTSFAFGLLQSIQTGHWGGFNPLMWLIERFADSPLPMNISIMLESSESSLKIDNQLATVSELLHFFTLPTMWLGWLIGLLLLTGTIYMRARATA